MYPVMINIREKKVVVVGGGKVAARKIKTLLAEQAAVTVVSPTLHADIPQAEVQWLARSYQTGDLEGAKLVFACTDQEEVNRQIMEEAAPSQLVNNTGDKTFSDFYNVAIARKKDVSVMISTNGLSPSRSKEIRKKIEAILDQL
ncbi:MULTISPECIES: bifunctional precorrin-2 dehydrogenase/sirohydrochlorin ferrochelatase [Streptococcus]|uniref:precorrin-2 dehydrogenase n=1 Tax=Streptococcus sanguinis SK160 TaxID=888812 RepID=F0ITI2_STRSA|nr:MULTISPECIES: NAD(P)-dependent oxidoreductase [Streptococcus]EGD38806.1 siroheme synthase domain protein [Streptococcus sanguinis SK160]RSH99265.1 Precorrin-2 dehydrogenase [Streptococcus sanguinis]RSI03677.1 Precorrin-2 dehydrogenase [Streptococcus sanguinis]RSI39683.1 Precorrin-2 dehydrogenase [Streptococcus sanguinis]WNU95286.1 NAD(P)-dependent oxidoreductase [Streptococcus sp. DTU_2020_1000888_1_SI_GRL_NUU_041A]